MLKLTELIIKDWCQHDKRKLQFSPGTNGIVGSNGKGKSNALAAAFTAITGRVMSGNIDDNIRYGSDKATVSLDFVQDGTVGNVTREFTAKELEPGVRDKVKSKAKLVFGKDTEPVTASSKVTQAMVDITGMEPGVIENHIFISQDKVTSLLFQTKSERLKSFLDLISEVQRAEPLRKMLDDELKRYPDVEVAADIDVLEARRKDLKAEIDEGEARHAELELGRREIGELDDIIARYKAATTAVTDKIEADKKLTEYDAVITELTVKQAEADGILAKECDKLSELEPAYNAAREAKENAERYKSIAESRARKIAERDTLVREINNKSTPDAGGLDFSAIATLTAECATMRSELDSVNKTLMLIENSDDCPTCKRPFANVADERIKYKAQREGLTKAYGTISESLEALNSAKLAYDKAMGEHENWVTNTTVRLDALQRDIAEILDVPAVAPEDLIRYEATIREFTELAQVIDEAERDSASVKSGMAVTQAKVDAIKENLVKLNEIVAAMPTDSDYNDAIVERDQQRALGEEISRISGILKAKEDELRRLDESITSARAAQARAVAVREYRQVLTVARDTLHREKLPQEVLFSYIGELDNLCNKFLNLFGNPFAINIERDMEMRCIMPSGYITSADRLSGGQKCVLAVAMRFAINELFAKDLGLLILDEPTAWMDDDNIECMGELISNVHQISKESGVQTIIITHARELIPSFEHVIQID